MEMPERRLRALAALRLPDELLRAQCEESFFVASGPGGQHRNKTASGVRLTHLPTEVSVTATERRSQAQNRDMALARLRQALQALTVVPKRRRPTRPTRSSKERRLAAKRRQSGRKSDRQWGGED